ncbi:hypothetical protein HMSSN036_77000 [Paenibacillus macerans]|nr:hypothetical protein HMSSN036_77000 [Paenibacillus macerans]
MRAVYPLCGRRYELEGERMYALVQEYVTRPAASLSFESHETYVDIQFIVSGEERIGWTMDGGRLNMIEDRLPGEDIRFYESAAAGSVSELLLGPGQFAVFSLPSCIALAVISTKRVQSANRDQNSPGAVPLIGERIWPYEYDNRSYLADSNGAA